MKKRFKDQISKAESRAASAAQSLTAADSLAKSLKTRVQEAKRRLKEARKNFKILRKHARQAIRDRRLARKERDAAVKMLSRLNAKVGPATKTASKPTPKSQP